MRHLLLIVPLALVALCITGFRYDTETHPVWATGPSSLAQGATGTVTLGFDQTGTTATAVALTSSDPTDLPVPAYVVLPAYASQVQFNVTMSSSATTGAEITASANGAQATSALISVGSRR